MKKRGMLQALALILPLLLLCACRQPVSEFNPSGPVSAWEKARTALEAEENREEPPETGKYIDMASLKDTLMDFCSIELAGLGGGTATMFADRADFPQMIEDTYGVPAELIKDGFVIDDNAGGWFEAVVLRVADKDAVEKGRNAVRAYAESLRAPFFLTEEQAQSMSREEAEEAYDTYVYLGTHRIIGSCWDVYLSFAICQEPEEFGNCVFDTIDSLRHSGQAPGRDPQAVEIAEGVFFVPVSWPYTGGEPDPDHPGRDRYVQPNEEDMSVYDTSAIVAAWRAGDPEGLSEYDRAIYDGAKEALDGILRDGMSEFGKEAAIYEWVIRNVGYDASHTDVLAETSRDSFTPYGGLVSRKAVCLGYAATFQLLAELAGLECVTVVGAGRGGDHAWNQVRLNGEWYCADVSWDQAIWSGGTMNGREWRYFNTTSDYMAQTGHQWDYDNVPEATAEDHGRP